MATFQNVALLSYQNTTVSSNVVTGEILEALSVTKTAVNDGYRPGSVITYAVSIANTGETAYSGLTVRDDLGAYTLGEGGAVVVPLDYVEGSLQYFADGVLQPDPAVTDSFPLTLTGIAVPANGNVMLLYQATVNEYAPIGQSGSIENTVVVSGGSLGMELEASAIVRAGQEPILSITKSISPVAVTGNGRLTYTFVMENRGSTEASGDVVLTDTFAPILHELAVTCNDLPWAAGKDYSYNETSGVFATAAGGISIPAATMVQDPDTGVWSAVPGACTLVVTGTI